jgi:YNFM family putative membrane transporter
MPRDSVIDNAPLVAGTPEFRRMSLGIFAGGFGTFSLLYCAQALLPMLAKGFGIGPAESSLSVSFATGALSIMLVVAGSLSESLGRKGVMAASLTVAALLTLGCAVTQGYTQLLVLRLLTGAALSGLPALIMAYVGEEVAASSVGYAIGLSIGGNAFGGMMGRVAAAAIADALGWRWAFGVLGAVGLICAALFWRSLPQSRRFEKQPLHLGGMLGGLGRHFAEPGLRWLFIFPFLMMGSFVTVYNYVGFRLAGPPFGLSQTAVGALFTVYLVGIVSSAWAGRLADRFGRRKMLWLTVAILAGGILLTLSDDLLVVVLGVAIFTGGFFGAHSIASSWVARRAHFAKAQAASLYLFFYYLGSSVVGTLGGVVYAAQGWSGVVMLISVLHLAGFAVAFRLSFLQPLPIPEKSAS